MSAGPVQVNGAQAAYSSTVFPGDRVQTAPNASALVKSPDALVSIRGDSTVKYDGPSVTLEHGVAAVTIANHMNARLGNLLVSAAPGAKFQVMSLNGVETIAAIEGPLTVTDSVGTITLASGEMMTNDHSRRDDDAPPLNIRRGLPGWVIEVIVEAGVAGGVIGGLAAAGDFSSRPPVSPSGP